MNEDRYTPEEQQTTQQLSAAPKPKLEAAARETIRQQMLTELRTGTISSPNRVIRGRAARPIWQIAAVAAAVAIVTMALIISQHLSLPSAAQNSATLTLANPRIVLMPTVTPAPTLAAVVPTQARPTVAATLIEPSLVNATVQPSSPTALRTTRPALIPGATVSPAPSSTPTPTGTSDVIVILEGPVTNIGADSLTINDFTVQVDPHNPILPLLDVGDTVHVEGTLDADGRIAAEVVSNNTDTTVVSGSPVTVSLDGPVEWINGNQVVVNSVPVQLAPNDPLLEKVHPGDFVRVQGNFQGTGAATILVVANITIINNVVVNGIPTCRYDVDAMGMGHWHCDDGMGMGDDGMGMGMGDPAMGMGDEGMGSPDPAMGMGP